MRQFLLFRIFPVFFLALCLVSCSPGGQRAAVLWTDRPEFAFYTEYFNNAQNQYRVQVRYFDSPARQLIDTAEYPDIVAGNWLKSASTRVFFKPLDSLFDNKNLSQSAFYPRLLAMGNIDGKQYLLPVSFNAPVLVFSRDRAELLSNPFTVGFEEIKKLGKDYNRQSGGVYTRMGFSPAWDSNFLFITAALFNVSFREASPLAWDAQALEQAMSFAYEWTSSINSSVQAEDDFKFKYFYEPAARLVLSGRILFTYMNSDDLFTQAEERRNDLDFRWITEQSTIPLSEDAVYMGLAKKGKAPAAANAFIRWFYQTGTQAQFLEKSRDNRMFEASFGIGGGFSALRSVTEQVFPQFYPELMGHMLPEESLSPASILPWNWTALKEHSILPYLYERARQPNKDDILPLERRIADWYRLNS
jgi:ABC-type glycerol-3-phosphate transport system substrate-binding protein